MPRQHAPFGRIQCPPDGVEDVEYTLPGNLWAVASDGSQWVLPNAVIVTPPKSSCFLFFTTLQTAKGDIPITISLSFNIIFRLV